ncbi:thymidine phosphorylase-like isoform X1 [Mya arenaria]|uniref:thymidine phosphorylase-like isoform X1 n=2 Tax=Mya arenaria TaxID=6604 RepID=UPI0022E90696|nr:thymidine phosphorylase-like isoform X1 [Mya arenaria]XP_052810284.1 thymidine phosphorylase-like isoform X1 [Mya arenaria]
MIRSLYRKYHKIRPYYFSVNTSLRKFISCCTKNTNKYLKNGTEKMGSQNRQRVDSVFRLRIADIIRKKRDGESLSIEEIEFFVEGVVNRSIQDAQLGAMLMAMYIRSLDSEETTYLTRAMTHSGEVLKWPAEWKGRIVDKHSTGGVGDKVSLILAPALAACGMKVPMVSGRGLSHTGGTLDKLEAIPGFTVSQSHANMIKILENVGCCIVGQTSNLVPADKIMYATRDVTSTTENIGLITSSIISKKVAESLDALVLDVKIGKGAFLKNEKDARELAQRMVAAGNGSGVQTVALLTDMNSPIGKKIGNAFEVAESIECLHGNGPNDLTDLVTRLGGQLLYKINAAESMDAAINMIASTLNDGRALAKFRAMIVAQGVQEEIADKLCRKGADVFEVLPKAKYTYEIQCAKSGHIHSIDSMNCAIVTGKLGAGRAKAGEVINFAVGIHLKKHIGDAIEKDEVAMVVHHDEDGIFPEEFAGLLKDAFVIGDRPVTHATRVLDVIT